MNLFHKQSKYNFLGGGGVAGWRGVGGRWEEG